MTDELLGKHKRKQVRAAMVVAKEEPISYDELKEILGVEDQSTMQEIIRGILDNGFIRMDLSKRNRFEYVTTTEEEIEPYKTEEKYG